MFIQFMTSATMQKYFAIHTSLAPSRIALYSDPEILEVNPQYRELFPVFQTATPRPQTPVYPIVSHILNDTLVGFFRPLSRTFFRKPNWLISKSTVFLSWFPQALHDSIDIRTNHWLGHDLSSPDPCGGLCPLSSL